MLFRLVFAFALIAALVVPSAPAGAQTAVTATITGTVADDAAKPIAGVRVTLAGPVSAGQTTGPDGTFSFPNVVGGSYLLTFEKTGFATLNTPVTATGGAGPVTVTLERATQSSLREIGRTSVSRNGTALNRTPSSQASIDSQTYIDRGQPQVSNLLEELPGIELQRFSSGGGPGANTVVAVRGSDPAETQTLIDGHPVSGGPEGSYLIQFLNPLLLSDIEVAKGPGAFGNQIANQVNGTVNFRTPSITPTFSARAEAGYDTYNGSTDSLLVSDTFGKAGFLAGYAQFGTPGYNTQPVLSVAANGTPGVGVIPDATATTYIASSQLFHNHSELLKFNYTFSNSTAVTLGYLGLHTYADYTGNLTTLEPFNIVAACPNKNAAGNAGPGTGAGCGPNVGYSGNPTYTNPALGGLVGHTVYASSTNDNLYLGNFENDNEPLFTADLRTTAGPGTLLARYYAASIIRTISDGAEANQPVQCDDPTCSFATISADGDLSGAFYQTQSDYLHGADFTYAVPVGPNTYTASYDTHGDRTTACSGGTPNPSGNKACSVPSIIQDFGTLSARGDFRFGSKIGVELANYFSHSTFVKARYDPRLGITFAPDANVVFRLAAGSGFVAPSASTAYDIIPHVSRKTLFTGTGAVPETSTSLDLGTDVRTGSDSKFAFDAYVTRLFNRFASVSNQVPGTFDGVQYTGQSFAFNQADALNKGLEFTYLKAPRYGFGTTDYLNFLRAYAGHSNFNSNFSQRGTVYGNEADGQQFPGYPYTKGRVELNYTTRNDLKPAFGATYYGAVNSFNEPAFVLFDARVTARLKGDLRLDVAMENVFNHDDYRTYGIYNYGYAPLQPSGPPVNTTLFFAPPRQVTFELSRTIGRAP